MKKTLLTVLFCLATIFSVAYADEDDKYVWTPPTGMLRGIVNMATCPGELVRGPVYYSQAAFEDHSYLLGIDGFLFGTITGAGMTLVRFSVGFLDLAAGIPGNYIHGDVFPTFFWQDLWYPEDLDE